VYKQINKFIETGKAFGIDGIPNECLRHLTGGHLYI
jgi:hypothetical protein